MSDSSDTVPISKSSFKEWLEKLQQESWQLELLISGFALFAIWEARSLIPMFDVYDNLHSGLDQTFSVTLDMLAIFLTVAWRIFFFNLLIHVFTRGLWIGAIGLRYVSSDIDLDYFDYQERYTRFLKRRVGSFDDYIERLERFASVLFAYTFLLFFVFLSFLLYFLEFSFILQLLGKLNLPAVNGIFSLVFLVLGILIFIDFISMGGIKKIKERNLSRIFYFFYRVFSFLTLSFVYRPLLYNFWDTPYTRRLFMISIPYMMAMTFLPNLTNFPMSWSPLEDARHAHQDAAEMVSIVPIHYDDERQRIYEQDNRMFRYRYPVDGISLESVELTGSHGRLFLRLYPNDGLYLTENRGLSHYLKTGLLFKNFRDHAPDSIELTIAERESEQLVQHLRYRREVREQIRAGTTTEQTPGVRRGEDGLELDDRFFDLRQDSIEQYWAKEEVRRKREREQNVLETTLSLMELFVDEQPYLNRCNCRFYQHPNVGEPGLLCYLPLDSLAEGEHLLHLKRERYRISEFDSLRTANYYVPFFKVRREDIR